MLISIFCKNNPNQTIFESYIDPLLCIKKIKENCLYLSYLAYAEYNIITDENYKIEEILQELLKKFPNRLEAYLRYWQLLVKGKYKDYKKAHNLSEKYWKSSMKLDENPYL